MVHQVSNYLIIYLGAGKTTLLNFLAGKDPSKNLKKKGEVYLNGINRKGLNYSQYLAYVQQDDILLQTMSVRECLTFAAKMRLPPEINKAERVQDLIDSLKLNKWAETKIGGPLLKGVSGGERKRTSIGVELITNPNLIFLDEPTTGLDSFTATNVMEVLKDLAYSGRTVISTIHQPNSEIFEMFDQLMLMAKGSIIYLNEAKKAVGYFKQIGYPCPSLTNPADFFMSMMSIESYGDVSGSNEEAVSKTRSLVEQSYNEKIDFFSTKYEQSELRWDHEYNHPEAAKLDQADEYRTGFFVQFCLLFKRSILNVIRIPLSSYAKAITYIVLAVLAILVFGQMGNDCASIQNRNGALFFVTLNMIMNAIQGVILLFPEERAVFLREQASGMYSPTAYFLAKVFSEIPGFIILPSLFVVISFFGLQLNDTSASHYQIYHGNSILLTFATAGFGMVIGWSVSDRQVAVALTPVLIIPFMLFSGFFFVNQNNIPFFLKPFEYISLFKYGYQVYIYNEYSGITVNCSGRHMPDEFHFKQTQEESAFITLGLGLGFYFISYLILLIVARRNK